MDERRDSGEYYPGGRSGGDAPTPPAPAIVVDEGVTKDSANPVKSSGIWGALWGAIAALPAGIASLYDWCVAQLAQKADAASVNAALAQKADAAAVNAALAQKASAADLRYRIAEAGFKNRFAESAFPITYRDKITSTPVTITAGDAGDITWNVQPDGGVYVSYNGFDFAYFSSTGDYGGSQPGVDLQFNGVAAADVDEPLVIIRVLADRTGNLITAQNGTASIDIELPEAVKVDGVRYCRDLIVDVDNSAGASDIDLELASDATAYLDAGGARYLVAVADGDDLADLLTVAAGARARLYFTETAQTATPAGGTEAVPVISLQRLTVVVGGAA